MLSRHQLITGMKKNTIICLLIFTIIFATGIIFIAGCKKDSTVPVLTTLALTGISQTTAESGGNITSDGNEPVSARGVCWSRAINPTISDSSTNDGTGIGTFASSLAGLTANTMYYVRAYATNSIGTAYGDELSFPTHSYSIGDAGPAGGLIFYDKGSYSNGWRYLEAAPSDQSSSAPWGCEGTLINGADGTGIGLGAQNTIDILAGCSTAGIAARLCDQLVLNSYSDWFLPSKDELSQMYLNLKANGLGGFANNWYFSSSEYSSGHAWHQNFSTGQQDQSGAKEVTPYPVRAVREF